MAKAFSYIRFSRPEQMRGDSLRRQTEAAEKWAAANGLVIDESLTDLGVSAYRGLNRVKGALGGFLSLVAKGQVPRGSFLIIESLDRFSREDALEVLTEFSKVLKAGITIVTLIDGQVYSTERIKAEPMGLFGSLMVMMRAHEESKTKASRLSASWANKRNVASKKVVTARVPGWLQVVTFDGERRIVFKPGQANLPGGRDIVRRIFAETIQGFGKRQVAARLNAAGVPTLDGGKAWHPSYIQKTLQNRATFGEMQSYRRDEEGRRVPAGPPLKDYYPAAVSESDFLRANAAKETRNVTGGRRGPTGVVNLFRGLAFCACGGKMTRVNKGPPPKGNSYLTCAEATRGACTNDRRWRLDLSEDRLLGSTVRLDLNKVLAKADEQEDVGLTVADMEAKVADMTKALERIRTLVEAGVEEYAERAIALSREIKQTKADASDARRLEMTGAHGPSADRRRELIFDLRARLEAAGEEERADLRTRLAQEVRATVKKVVFGRNAISATYQGVRWFGKVPRTAQVSVQLFSDDPDDLIDMAEMSLDADTLARQDRQMVEFLRRSRLRRDHLTPDLCEPELGLERPRG